MLYNLVRPPDEPCLEIVKKKKMDVNKKRGGFFKQEEKKAQLSHLSHNLWKKDLTATQKIYVVKKNLTAIIFYWELHSSILPSFHPAFSSVLSARHVICVHGLWCCFRPRSKATLKRYVALAGRINSHLISFSHVSDGRLCSSRPCQLPDSKEKHT